MKNCIVNNLVKSYTLRSLLAVMITISSTSCGVGDSHHDLEIAGLIGPEVSQVDGNLQISMIFSNIAINNTLKYKVPKLPNTHLKISPEEHSGGTNMSINISLRDILNDQSELDPGA